MSQNFIVNFQTYGTFLENKHGRSVRDSGVASATGKSDLQMLHDLRFEYPKICCVGYLNINSLRNKIHDLRLHY